VFISLRNTEIALAHGPPGSNGFISGDHRLGTASLDSFSTAQHTVKTKMKKCSERILQRILIVIKHLRSDRVIQRHA